MFISRINSLFEIRMTYRFRVSVLPDKTELSNVRRYRYYELLGHVRNVAVADVRQLGSDPYQVKFIITGRKRFFD